MLPGAIGAAVVDGPLTLETLDPSEAERALAGPAFASGLPSFDVPASAPLVLPFGHLSPEPNVDLYLALCERLAGLVYARCSGATSDPGAATAAAPTGGEASGSGSGSGAQSQAAEWSSVRQSGLIINTCSWLQSAIDGCSY